MMRHVYTYVSTYICTLHTQFSKFIILIIQKALPMYVHLAMHLLYYQILCTCGMYIHTYIRSYVYHTYLDEYNTCMY